MTKPSPPLLPGPHRIATGLRSGFSMHEQLGATTPGVFHQHDTRYAEAFDGPPVEFSRTSFRVRLKGVMMLAPGCVAELPLSSIGDFKIFSFEIHDGSLLKNGCAR